MLLGSNTRSMVCVSNTQNMFLASDTRSMVCVSNTRNMLSEATLTVKLLTISIAHLLLMATCVIADRLPVDVDSCSNQHIVIRSIASVTLIKRRGL